MERREGFGMSIAPRRIKWGKKCFVPCPPERCDCGASAARLGIKKPCSKCEGRGMVLLTKDTRDGGIKSLGWIRCPQCREKGAEK